MTCAKAVGYVKKLVARHVRTNQPFAGGPSGWTCKAQASKSGLAYVGGCNPKKEGEPRPQRLLPPGRSSQTADTAARLARSVARQCGSYGASGAEARPALLAIASALERHFEGRRRGAIMVQSVRTS